MLYLIQNQQILESDQDEIELADQEDVENWLDHVFTEEITLENINVINLLV